MPVDVYKRQVLVNLIEYVRATSGCSLPEAVRQALRQVIGAYAIAVVEKGNHDRIVAARQSSPMVVGVGDEMCIRDSSRSPARWRTITYCKKPPNKWIKQRFI